MSKTFDGFHKTFVDQTAYYFQKLLDDDNVGCAIRLAELDGEREEYVTKARSFNLEKGRRETSQPIPFDKGIPNALSRKSELGVYIINSIKRADENIWVRTPNDEHYDDVKRVMVAPINGYEDGTKHMMGLLFITSKGKWFKKWQTPHVMAFADYLGSVYPVIYALEDVW